MLAVFKASRLPPFRSQFIELEEDGMSSSHTHQQVFPVTSVYANYDILYSCVKCWSVGLSTQARMLKRSRSSGSSAMIEGAVTLHQRTISEMMNAVGPDTKEIEVKKQTPVWIQLT